MQLKDYQAKALETVQQFLEYMAEEKKQGNAKHASMDAWATMFPLRPYVEKKNGLLEDVPNFCLKIPTGGGKTLLAVKALDLINTIYRRKKTGLVLWVVPSTQIYNQTIKALGDKDHPYRQHLDLASGGRTVIKERTDKFMPEDIAENLVVLMLMLPAAARQSKETLRMFRDNGNFQEFFPDEDNIKEQEERLDKYPNLDTYEQTAGFWGRQIKTSLGNTLRLLSPVIILDEGHKAYSENAQSTLLGFNPSMIVELSATPTDKSNKLVDIPGLELAREDMIKLDLHIYNKASPDWKDALLDSYSKLGELEQKAREYEGKTGQFIRPIMLIQVERTGKDQRGGRFIHADDVREHLIKALAIPPEQIAIKSSQRDELKEIDDIGGLLSPNCQIRYIITKQALQEGWDCPFAYVLAILTNPAAQTALTQLVGRILRQPYARKTGVLALDESYVFCFQKRGGELLHEIRNGFGREGLGDLAGRIITDAEEQDLATERETVNIRPEFSKAAKEIILPVFVVKDNNKWRQVSYEQDIISKIDWGKANLEPLKNLYLDPTEESDKELIETLSPDISELVKQTAVRKLKTGGIAINSTFVTRHLLDIIPNPWQAHIYAESVLSTLLANNPEKKVASNFVYIIEELRKHLAKETNRLAKAVFMVQLEKGTVRFLVVGNTLGYSFPSSLEMPKTAERLTAEHGEPLQFSLFEKVPKADVNDLEKAVIWYLEKQERLFFWYRNRARYDYYIQGWQKQRIFPDFVFTTGAEGSGKADAVYVLETKGEHLKGNLDTEYKSSVFDLCNKLAKEYTLNDLGLALKDRPIKYMLSSQDEWQNKLSEILET